MKNLWYEIRVTCIITSAFLLNVLCISILIFDIASVGGRRREAEEEGGGLL